MMFKVGDKVRTKGGDVGKIVAVEDLHAFDLVYPITAEIDGKTLCYSLDGKYIVGRDIPEDISAIIRQGKTELITEENCKDLYLARTNAYNFFNNSLEKGEQK